MFVTNVAPAGRFAARTRTRRAGGGQGAAKRLADAGFPRNVAELRPRPGAAQARLSRAPATELPANP